MNNNNNIGKLKTEEAQAAEDYFNSRQEEDDELMYNTDESDWKNIPNFIRSV
jgi:nuclear transport factor 2 (NTF2) superfamily protein